MSVSWKIPPGESEEEEDDDDTDEGFRQYEQTLVSTLIFKTF